MMPESDRVVIFDTTLRDGEQSPGCSMSVDDKVRFAHQLARLGVDVIEAGFPIASMGEFRAVRKIATEVEGPVICALARSAEVDVRRAGEALKGCSKARIHTFLASSDEHLAQKLRINRKLAIEMAVRAITIALEYTKDVEFSPEDASRTSWEFLAEIVRAAIDAGATTINIPDTTGYALPSRFGQSFSRLFEHVPAMRKITVGVHCHNDLSNAVANSLVAVEAGARQVELCVAGIGERAGNAAIEPFVMALKVHQETLGLTTNIVTTELVPTALMLSHIIGKPISDTAPVIGSSIFAHASGVHQAGVIRATSTYQIMRPEDVGWKGESFPIQRHSGRHAVQSRLEDLGYSVGGELLDTLYEKVMALADVKGMVHNEDLHMLMGEIAIEAMVETKNLFSMSPGKIQYGSDSSSDEPRAQVLITRNSQSRVSRGKGDGPIAALFVAIRDCVVSHGEERFAELKFVDWRPVKGLGGAEATGFVFVELELNGRRLTARAGNPDVVKATAMAILYAVNQFLTTMDPTGTMGL